MDINDKIDYFRKRTDNFVSDTLPIFNYDNPILLKKLNYYFDWKEDYFNYIESEESLTADEIIPRIFSCVYNSELLSLNIQLSKNAYEACLFFTLCFFLHNSKRCKHKSLTEFTYDNSPMGYNKNDSSMYCPPDHHSDLVENEARTLRKHRNRLFSQRDSYPANPQWNAMRKDSEFEWTLYFEVISAANDDPVFNTFKRLGNLNNDLFKVFKSDNITKEEIETAYKKFISKLNKIKYSNYLETSKYILDRIYDEKIFYGVNIYRLEKEFRILENINAVNNLLKCKSPEEEEEILMKGYCLRDIWFPKVHMEFEKLTYNEILYYIQAFFNLLNFSSVISCFIFDELVEKNRLGEDWEKVFYNIINEMADRVFYVPSDLDFSVSPTSQEKFVKYLSSDVQYYLRQYWDSLNRTKK